VCVCTCKNAYTHTCTHTPIYIVSHTNSQAVSTGSPEAFSSAQGLRHQVSVKRLSLCKILFRLKALLWESIALYSPPTCKAYAIAILLHAHCAIYAHPPTPDCYAIHHTILVMAMSCKGQPTTGCIVSTTTSRAVSTGSPKTFFCRRRTTTPGICWPLHDISITNIAWCMA